MSEATRNLLTVALMWIALAVPLGGQGKTGHFSTLHNRPFPVSGIEAD